MTGDGLDLARLIVRLMERDWKEESGLRRENESRFIFVEEETRR